MTKKAKVSPPVTGAVKPLTLTRNKVTITVEGDDRFHAALAKALVDAAFAAPARGRPPGTPNKKEASQ